MLGLTSPTRESILDDVKTRQWTREPHCASLADAVDNSKSWNVNAKVPEKSWNVNAKVPEDLRDTKALREEPVKGSYYYG